MNQRRLILLNWSYFSHNLSLATTTVTTQQLNVKPSADQIQNSGATRVSHMSTGPMMGWKNNKVKQRIWHEIVAVGAINTKRKVSELSAHE